MKILSSFQLVTVLAYFSIATVKATPHRIFRIYSAMHELGLGLLPGP